MAPRIIYENKDLLVVDKPAGILSEGGEESVVDWIKNQFPPLKNLDWPDRERLGLVHRLDKDTSGVLLIAKNPETLINLQNQFKKRKVKKTYLALVYGKPEPKRGKLQSFIGIDKKKKRQKSWLIDWEIGKTRKAETQYQVLKSGFLPKDEIKVSLLELKPLTGRTHQIRAQLKQIGNPIVGDNLYSTKISRKINKALGLRRHFLHAKSLTFKEPATKKTIRLKAELPSDFQTILQSIKWSL